MRLAAAGVAVELPAGWEGEIDRPGVLAPQGGHDISRPTVAHFANFPLPSSRADFGAGAVDRMEPGDVFVVLFEYGPESVGTVLFSAEGVPRILAKDFDRNALQQGVPGQSGLQRFFTVSGRPFCLYVVVGSHIDRADAVPAINQILESLEVS